MYRRKTVEVPKNDFDEILDRMHDEMYRYICKLAYNRDIIEDVMQETFFEIFKNITVIKDMDIGTQRSYVYTIARNWLFKYSSREHKHLKNQEPYDDQLKLTTDDFSDRIVENEFIISILDKLTQNEKSLLIKHYLEGLSLVEIAKLTNEPVGTVKVRLSRLRKKIRDEYN